MIVLGKILGFVFNSKLAQAGLAALALLGLVASFAHQQRSIGAVKERAITQEKANDNVRKADDVRRRAREPGARGVRDPYARD